MYRPDLRDIEQFQRAEQARINYHLDEAHQQIQEIKPIFLERIGEIQKEGRLRKDGVLDRHQYMDRVRQHYSHLTPLRRTMHEAWAEMSSLRQQADDLEQAVEEARNELRRPPDMELGRFEPRRVPSLELGILFGVLSLLFFFLSRPRR